MSQSRIAKSIRQSSLRKNFEGYTKPKGIQLGWTAQSPEIDNSRGGLQRKNWHFLTKRLRNKIEKSGNKYSEDRNKYSESDQLELGI